MTKKEAKKKLKAAKQKLKDVQNNITNPKHRTYAIALTQVNVDYYKEVVKNNGEEFKLEIIRKAVNNG